jgi:hypothetical protein
VLVLPLLDLKDLTQFLTASYALSPVASPAGYAKVAADAANPGFPILKRGTPARVEAPTPPAALKVPLRADDAGLSPLCLPAL